MASSTPTRSGLVRLARLVGDSCSNGVLAEGLLQFFSFHYSLPPHGGPLRTTFLPGSLLSACQHKATKSSAFLLNGGWLEFFRGDKHLFSASCSVFLSFFFFFSFNGIVSDSCHSREAYCLPATTILGTRNCPDLSQKLKPLSPYLIGPFPGFCQLRPKLEPRRPILGWCLLPSCIN
jgi:hypothetical protein